MAALETPDPIRTDRDAVNPIGSVDECPGLRGLHRRISVVAVPANPEARLHQGGGANEDKGYQER